MRMLLLFILLLVPYMAMANKTDCPTITSSETCRNTAGCHLLATDCNNCAADHYCPGSNNAQILCSDASNGTFNKSDEGAESEVVCYKNIDCFASGGSTEQCRQYLRGTISCPTLRNLHTDSNDGNCYTNIRFCRLFGHENCDENQISGNATWSSDHSGNRWNINSCNCGATDFEDNTDKFCHGQQGGARPSATSVPHANSIINYDTSTGGYYCTRCIHDNGNTKYYANTTFSDGIQCSPNTAQGRVCKCETTDEKGYWRQGECNTDTNWENNNQICKAIPCNPGKTTNDVLPISENDSVCNFGSETQLCDDAGCISLDGLGGVSAPNWTYIE